MFSLSENLAQSGISMFKVERRLDINKLPLRLTHLFTHPQIIKENMQTRFIRLGVLMITKSGILHQRTITYHQNPHFLPFFILLFNLTSCLSSLHYKPHIIPCLARYQYGSSGSGSKKMYNNSRVGVTYDMGARQA